MTATPVATYDTEGVRTMPKKRAGDAAEADSLGAIVATASEAVRVAQDLCYDARPGGDGMLLKDERNIAFQETLRYLLRKQELADERAARQSEDEDDAG